MQYLEKNYVPQVIPPQKCKSHAPTLKLLFKKRSTENIYFEVYSHFNVHANKIWTSEQNWPLTFFLAKFLKWNFFQKTFGMS